MTDGEFWDSETITITVGGVAQYVCGDVNADFTVSILDIVYLINYIYRDGPSPECAPVIACADVDGDFGSAINLLDIVYLINYLYKDGPAPVEQQGICYNILDKSISYNDKELAEINSYLKSASSKQKLVTNLL